MRVLNFAQRICFRVSPKALGGLLTIVLFAGIGGTCGSNAEIISTKPELLKRHLVDIGEGRHRNLLCFGNGAPTVVFEQGTGSEIAHWNKVSDAVSSATRTCFYDRAGYGFSDPADRPMTLRNVSDDLHRLLMRAGVQGPIVLVGHSLGGFYATYYADRFPADVAGMVLIEPSFAGMYDGLRKGNESNDFAILAAQTLQGPIGCALLARQHKLSLTDRHDCFALGHASTPEEVAYMDRFTKPYRSEAVLLEMEATIGVGDAVPENDLEEQTARRSFGDMPLIVLTAGNSQEFPILSAQANQENIQSWRKGHDELAARSSRGISILVPDSTHFIQLDKPSTVIDSVIKVVDQIRREHKS